MINIDLKCWHCGKVTEIEASCHPQLGIELIQMAWNAGMAGYMDYRWHRTLLFCNDKCAKEELTKSGSFRKYPKPKGAA